MGYSVSNNVLLPTSLELLAPKPSVTTSHLKTNPSPLLKNPTYPTHHGIANRPPNLYGLFAPSLELQRKIWKTVVQSLPSRIVDPNLSFFAYYRRHSLPATKVALWRLRRTNHGRGSARSRRNAPLLPRDSLLRKPEPLEPHDHLRSMC